MADAVFTLTTPLTKHHDPVHPLDLTGAPNAITARLTSVLTYQIPADTSRRNEAR